jgi:predicted cation transporter
MMSVRMVLLLKSDFNRETLRAGNMHQYENTVKTRIIRNIRVWLWIISLGNGPKI